MFGPQGCSFIGGCISKSEGVFIIPKHVVAGLLLVIVLVLSITEGGYSEIVRCECDNGGPVFNISPNPVDRKGFLWYNDTRINGDNQKGTPLDHLVCHLSHRDKQTFYGPRLVLATPPWTYLHELAYRNKMYDFVKGCVCHDHWHFEPANCRLSQTDPVLRALQESQCREEWERAHLPIDTVDTYGQTPLWWAAQQCNSGMVLRLMLAGANVTLADAQGTTPLHAAVRGIGLECDCGRSVFDVTHCTDHWQHDQECLFVARALINAGASANAKDHYGQKPVHLCTEMSARLPYSWSRDISRQVCCLLTNAGTGSYGLDLYYELTGTTRIPWWLDQPCTVDPFMRLETVKKPTDDEL